MWTRLEKGKFTDENIECDTRARTLGGNANFQP